MPDKPTRGSLGEWKQAWATRDKSQANSDEVPTQLAVNYVNSHPELEPRYGHLSIEQCVKMVDMFREAGDQEKLLELEVYIMGKFEPQVIGGRGRVNIRKSHNGA